jgi:hypothetical protein
LVEHERTRPPVDHIIGRAAPRLGTTTTRLLHGVFNRPGTLGGQSPPDILLETPKIATTLLLPPMKDCVTSSGPVRVPSADRPEAEVGIECLRLNFYDDAIGHFQQIRDEASRTELVQLTQRIAAEFDAGSRYWQIRLILGFYNRPSPTPPHTAFEHELMAHYASLDQLEKTRADMIPTLSETV